MRRVFRFGFQHHIQREVDDEIAFHLAMRAESLAARGLHDDAARAEALRRFGDLSSVRQSCVTFDQERDRAMARANLLVELRGDLAYAARILRRAPGFTAVVALTLALGIGANTAIFTLVDAVLLRAIPVYEPERLVAVGDPSRIGSLSTGTPRTDILSYPVYRDLLGHVTSVSGLLASGRVGRLDFRVDGGAAVEHPRARYVSANYFAVLGVTAERGRTFDARTEDVVGGAPVAVISDAYWERRFARAPDILGRAFVVNGSRLTIVGVARPGFDGEIVGRTNDVWLPLSMQPVLEPHQPMLQDREASWLLLLGRLAPGATLAQAEAELTTVIRQELAEHATDPATARDLAKAKVWVGPGAKGFSWVRSTFGGALLTLMAGAALLLVIICANIANLLLARAAARSREMAVRLSLGANRWRIVRQLLSESLLLALTSAAAGLVVAWWGSRLLLALAAQGIAIPLDIHMDARVLGYTAAVSVLCVLLFGLAPALRASRVDLAAAMRMQARSVTGGSARGSRHPLGRLMIAGQVALSLVLLVAAGLLVHSLRNVQEADTGLDRDHLLVVEVDAVGRGYTGDRIATVAQQIAASLGRLPGVAAVAYSENGLFSGTESGNSVRVPGFVARTAQDSNARSDQVSPGYFHAVGARVLEGRELEPTDVAGSERVVVVNEGMARHYWGASNPLGKTLLVDDSIRLRVVGVVGDVREQQLLAPPEQRFYVSYLQHPLGAAGSLRFEVRTPGDPAALAGTVRRAIAADDPLLRITSIDPLGELMRDSIREQRLLARLALGIGAVALLLAAIGLYGVLSYAVARRTGEIGLRVALGAEPGSVVAMIIGDGLRLLALGLLVGAPLALLARRLLASQLHGVGALDPLAVGGALAVLTVSAIVASWVPARRAAEVEPVVALREE